MNHAVFDDIDKLLEIINPSDSSRVVNEFYGFLMGRRPQILKKELNEGVEKGDGFVISLMNSSNIIGLSFEDVAKKYEIIDSYYHAVDVKDSLVLIEKSCKDPERLFQSNEIKDFIVNCKKEHPRLDELCLSNIVNLKEDTFFGQGIKRYFLLSNCLVAALFDNSQAQLMMSDLLLYMEKDDIDHHASAIWCKMSADHGYGYAQLKLKWDVDYVPISIQSLPSLVNHDYDRYLMISELNTDDDMFLKGLYYEKCPDPDYKKAYESYKYAVGAGNRNAEEKLNLSSLDSLSAEESFVKLQICSFSNDSEVDYRLALAYLNGIGTPVSLEKANEHLLKSASNGNKEAKKMLDWKNDKGVPDRLHFKKIQLADKRGEVDASVSLAKHYRDGIGTNRSEDMAIKIYRSVSTELKPEDCYDFAEILRSASLEDNFEECYELYRRSADGGYKSAIKVFDLNAGKTLSDEELFFRRYLSQKILGSDNLYWIAKAYEEGLGVKADFEKYRHYLKEAAAGNSIEAQYELALLFGKYHDNVSKKEWLIKAASNGHIQSIRLLPKQDSFDCCLKAANEGHANVYSLIAEYYEIGYGTKQSFEESLAWYKKAAQNNDVIAIERLDPSIIDYDIDLDKEKQYRKFRLAELNGINVYAELAACYRDGIGVEQDPKEYHKYLLLSAESNNVGSQRELALFFENGKKYHEALIWFKRAADLGDSYSKKHIDLEKLTSLTDQQLFSNLMLYSEEGDPQIIYYIGKCKEQGKGTKKNLTEALSLIEQSATLGYPDAIYWMGIYCEKNHTGIYSYNKAIEWYQKSADLGNKDAAVLLDWSDYDSIDDKEKFRKCCIFSETGDLELLLKLAICYSQGIGTGRDNDKAFVIFLKCKELNNSDALLWMGKYCERMNDKGHSYSEAIEYYTLASNAGNDEATRLLDWSNYSDLYEDDKYRKCLLFSESNDPDHIFSLACCYHDGIGTSKDLVKAKYWYEVARKLGSVNASFRLGTILEDEGQYSAAYAFYKKCANEGLDEAISYISLDNLDSYSELIQFRKCMLHSNEKNAEVQYRLGIFFEKGIVVQRDYAKAAVCFKKAIALNLEEAKTHFDLSRLDMPGITDDEQFDLLMLHESDDNPVIYYRLAQLHDKGIASNSSDKLVFDYFKKAADLGHIESCYYCGSMILDKKGNNYQISTAEKYLQLATDKGIVQARAKLGRCCFFKQKPNYKKAAMWCRIAADSNDVDGQYMVGYMFEKGLGFPIFYSESVKWYSLAVQQGSFDAKFRLAILYYRGLGLKQSIYEAEAMMAELKAEDLNKLKRLFDEEIKNGNQSIAYIAQKIKI